MSERRGTKGLELWCRRMTEGYPGVKIDNMTTSWRDGLAFCAIIHHFRPDLIEFSKLNKDDVYHNNELAFRIAEQYLGIPALLEPEDMVEYAVPDRLSILTYLSQFYQTFAVAQGKTGARIAPKRAQSTPDHGIVSPASTSPPTKVPAIIAGRIRRDPCAKCGLPVFIAERLNVGKLLYHRTCFRCARCNSQLTLANYYETENSEFCCEICPDEEKSPPKKDSVLTRSMSDEEKSASLKTYSAEPDAYSTQFETALEFPNDSELKKNATLTPQESTVYSKARSHFFKTQMEDSDSGTEEDIPPDLPKSSPPPRGPLTSSDNSGFPKFNSNDKETLNSNVNKANNIVSKEEKPLDNHIVVTKDNSGPSSIVKARMELFENSKQDTATVFLKKSDVNNRSSEFNSFSVRNKNVKVPSSEAKVVTLEELEDFDNISKKDLELDNEKHSGSEKSLDIQEKLKDNASNLTEIVLEERCTTNNDLKDTSEAMDVNILQASDNKDHDEPIEAVKESDVLDKNIQGSTEDIKEDNIETSKKDDSIVEIASRTTSSEESVIVIASSSEETTKSPLADSNSVIVIDDSSSNKDSEEDLNRSLSYQTKSTTDESGFQTTDADSSSQQNENLIVESEELRKEESSEDVVHSEESISNKEAPETETDKSVYIISEEDSNVSLESSKEMDKQVVGSSKGTAKQGIEKQESYPEDLNPFGDDDGSNANETSSSSLNPFGEYDDEEDSVVDCKFKKPIPVPSPRLRKKILPTEDDRVITGTPEHLKRIYIERISVNPFEQDEDDKPPLPTSRRKKIISAPKISLSPYWKEEEDSVEKNKKEHVSLNPFGSDDEDDEPEDGRGKGDEAKNGVPVPKPRISITSAPEPKPRDHSVGLSPASRGKFGGSNESSLSSVGTIGSARKKKPAPRPPVPFARDVAGENGPVDSADSSLTPSPSHSVAQSPYLAVKHRKPKRAPLPPGCTSTPVPNEGASRLSTNGISPVTFDSTTEISTPKEKETVIRKDDDVEQEKNVKDELNRNRQSQNLQHLQSPTSSEDSSRLSGPNKSTFGKWKRHKGKAPTRPIPQRRSIKSLPLTEIRRELDIIEIQQQGLEKQGVKIEQIIRDKCEGGDDSNPDATLPIEVEDLILQLFELVNEKNELFRKQAELMYLRRQQRLEEEHADVEYQIRCLMLQPEANKTDSDKAKEEELIQRLVDIVERRNEIIECLEMDRVREAEEDDSINNQINLYTQGRDIEKDVTPDTKKQKKKHKKINKLINTLKHKEKDNKHKIDADKDVDETEANTSTMEKKKKKKFNLF